MKPIHIFKTGKHTDSHGQTLNFSDADLAKSIQAYNPSLHQAPIVVGHPSDNAPAYGWVKGLSGDAGNLYADPDQVNPEFSEQVKKGSYKKVSASFYPPDSSNNPVQGVYYLRHVGFLGAQPPAIKGLEPVSFSDGDEALTITLDFSENETHKTNPLNRLIDNFATWLKGAALDYSEANTTPDATSAPTADSVQGTLDANEIAQDGAAAKNTPPKTATQPQDTTMTPEEIAALKAENETLKQEKADALAKQAKAKRDAQHQANTDFAESLVNDKKLLPADKGLIVAVLDGLDQASTDKPLEFGEGEGKQPLTDALKAKWQRTKPNTLLFSEMATKPKATSTQNSRFDAPAGTVVDADSLAAHQDILAYSDAHNVDYETAAMAVGG